MKDLNFSYSMQLEYEHMITDEFFTLRALPLSDGKQKVVQMEYSIAPMDYKNRDRDCWGNQILWGGITFPHDFFSINVTGTVRVDQSSLNYASERELLYLYKMNSALTKTGERLHAFGTGISRDPETIMHQVYGVLSYEKGATDMNTTAEQALTLKKGVCQDYAHIMLSVLRNLGIPARYAAGMMLGEGLSHAWVEVYTKSGWMGFDPTNDRRVDDGYIKIAHGRDAFDCKLNKGIYRGGGGHTQKVKVVVTEAEDYDRRSDFV